MKTNEEYIDDYLDAYNEALKVNRLSRHRISMEEFLKTIEELRSFQGSNEIITQRYQGARVSQMLWTLNPLTIKELKENCDKLAEHREEIHKKMISVILEEIKKMKSPLNTPQIRLLTKALYRGQITEDMIPKDIMVEYSKTSYYLAYSKSKKNKE